MDYQKWWDKECIDLEGSRSVSGAVEVVLEEDGEEQGGGVGNGDRTK